MSIKFVIIRTITNALILGAGVYLFLSFAPIINAELIYSWNSARGVTYSVDPVETEALTHQDGSVELRGESRGFISSYFSSDNKDIKKAPIKVEPTSTDFGIVIEKIGVNAPVVANVDSSSYKEYTTALRSGVAHAKGSSYPGQPGNVYIHGHSSLGFWQLGGYATVFTLLNKLEEGDRIVTYYQGERFDYRVSNKEIFPGYDITPLARDYDESVLTLQTCDPPGTAINRLIITARLIS